MYIDSVGFAIYLTVFLLYLYTYLSGGLLARVKGNGSSFAADYSPELHFYQAYMSIIILRLKLGYEGITSLFFNRFAGIFPLRQST